MSEPIDFLPIPLPVVPAGAIFDCDGTLADSMPLHYVAWHQTLEPLGLPFPEEQFYAWGGVTAREIIVRLNAEHGMSVPPGETAHAKEMAYAVLISQMKPLTKVVAEARRLNRLGVPLAVASGGMNSLVEETLRVLGIRDLFQTVAAAEDVQNGKPAPDVFLLAAERLGIPPEDCVVFEDAPAGFEAARRAGMRVVNVIPFL